MKPIVDFTTETSKETEWDNIACVHRDTLVATTWSFKQQKMGELKLRHQRFKVTTTGSPLIGRFLGPRKNHVLIEIRPIRGVFMV